MKKNREMLERNRTAKKGSGHGKKIFSGPQHE
jgi:hypothetical protein